MTKEKKYSNLENINDEKSPTNPTMQSPIKGLDNTLLNFYKTKEPVNKIAKFDSDYEDAISLMGGDKLLRRKKDSSNVIIRKTTTVGLYKVLISENLTQMPEIRIMDESELFKKYVKGTISKLSNDKYEITYFDYEGDVVIEHYSKNECINFMEKKKLIF